MTFHPECSDYPPFKPFGARWSVKRIHKTPFPYTYTPVFLLRTAAWGTAIHPYSFRGYCNTGSIGIVKRRENKPALLDSVKKGSCWEPGSAEGSWHVWHRMAAGMTLLHIADNSPIGLGASLHLKQQAPILSLLSQGLNKRVHGKRLRIGRNTSDYHGGRSNGSEQLAFSW